MAKVIVSGLEHIMVGLSVTLSGSLAFYFALRSKSSQKTEEKWIKINDAITALIGICSVLYLGIGVADAICNIIEKA